MIKQHRIISDMFYELSAFEGRIHNQQNKERQLGEPLRAAFLDVIFQAIFFPPLSHIRKSELIGNPVNRIFSSVTIMRI